MLGAICTLLVLTSIEPHLFQDWISRFASHLAISPRYRFRSERWRSFIPEVSLELLQVRKGPSVGVIFILDHGIPTVGEAKDT